MLNIELNGTEPEHVTRIAPKISVDAQGNITWVPSLLDHNAKVFHRGKTVTNEEFNELFLHQVYRGNYLTDSLSQFFDKHLSNAIRGKFRSDFKLVPSYIKTFTSEDWGELQKDGYYYITIPASEHGFEIDMNDSTLDRVNIDIEMYLLDPNGLFFEVTQAHIDTDNTVHIYTDDNTIPGFIVIRANEKSYALVDVTIGADQVEGLHAVATSGRYKDLVDINAADGPDTRIKRNADDIVSILTGQNTEGDVVAVAQSIKAVEATDAINLTGSIRQIPLENIFEGQGTSYIVKEARTAHDYSEQGGIANRFTTVTNTIDTTKSALNTQIDKVEDDLTDTINRAIADVKQGNTIAKIASDYTTTGGIANKFTSVENTINQIKSGNIVIGKATNIVQLSNGNYAPIIQNSTEVFNTDVYVWSCKKVLWSGSLNIQNYGSNRVQLPTIASGIKNKKLIIEYETTGTTTGGIPSNAVLQTIPFIPVGDGTLIANSYGNNVIQFEYDANYNTLYGYVYYPSAERNCQVYIKKIYQVLE